MGRLHSIQYRSDHAIRILACTAAVIAMLILLVRLLPPPSAAPVDVVFTHHHGEIIEIEEIAQTRQAASRPPPPLPPIPLEVADDIELDEPELDFDVTLPVAERTAPGRDPEGQSEPSAGVLVEESARPVRFVEPEYSVEARRRQISAEVVIEMRVHVDGQVSDVQIVERYLNRDGRRERVDTLGYGLEEAAIAAAERWVFRPARYGGQAVESRYRLILTFGEGH